MGRNGPQKQPDRLVLAFVLGAEVFSLLTGRKFICSDWPNAKLLGQWCVYSLVRVSFQGRVGSVGTEAVLG